MCRYFSIILLCFCNVLVTAQSVSLEFVVVDNFTNKPVNDVHVFISNSRFGTTSDDEGKIRLTMPRSVTADLLISHISFDLIVLPYLMYQKIQSSDTIFLIPNGVDLSTITVEDKRSRQWKRSYKKFIRAFLGDDAAAKKCRILNPEVLRFEVDNGVFKTKAIDLIQIKNDYLGYDIHFHLSSFNIQPDGSMKYRGHAQYFDLSNAKNQLIFNRRREKAFIKSPRHFFKQLISDQIKNQYKIERVKHQSGQFISIAELGTSDLLQWDSTHSVYRFKFEDYIQVTNYNVKEIGVPDVDIRVNGLESQRFGNTQNGVNTIIKFATSQLYKIEPLLYLDGNGHLMNPQDVQEFGAWARQRMAYALPLDYGVDYSSNELIAKMPKPKNNLKSDLQLFKSLIYDSPEKRKQTLVIIKEQWNNGYYAPLLDVVLLSTDKELVKSIMELMRFKSNQQVSDYYGGLRWLWQQDFKPSKDYVAFKAEIYQHIDPAFKAYFEGRQDQSDIAIQEIVWGGVKQDGIPPLRYPELVNIEGSDEMKDDQIVFGIYLNGQARAYPKRILGWHELVVDSVNQTNIALVYCTLCGTAIAYDLRVRENKYDLGTSGFLYRSNKLMYDRATQSLWSTIEGKPVMGPLVGDNISLLYYPVMTTTWGEWKERHPDTKVLSDKTGHIRNYNEGEAYKTYYSTDNLMFPVPKSDHRLKNKEEVLVIRSEGYHKDPLAISVKYLKRHSLYEDEIKGQKIVILTSKNGSSSVYEAKHISFKKYKKGKLTDADKQSWQVTEESLNGPNGEKLKRLSSHNIFWFAWYNTYPDTRLVK